MLTTTDKYQVKPDYYSTKQECVQSNSRRFNTNPRYKYFTQTHFTAGDPDQFIRYKDSSNGKVCTQNISLSENKFNDVEIPVRWNKYNNINANAVMNTFWYMFNKFKKGIFVKIKNGQLAVFLPFSKKDFVNEWFHLIKIDPKYQNLHGFIKYITQIEGRRHNPRQINNRIDTWFGNNCLVRYEYPIHEGDTNNTHMRDMFRTLCQERKVPDIEFFVNRRDFPVIKRDGTEAYEEMFGDNLPLLSHNYDKYAPILSMVTTKDNADIPIPTGEDWARIGSQEGKFFPRGCKDFLEGLDPVPWKDRKETAVFRGGSTGCGVTINTNIRLKLAYISQNQPREQVPLLDAGITNWNVRPRKLKNERYLQTIDVKKLPFGLVDKLTPQQQTQYKYLINVDGHVSAFRLSLELKMGSCILLADSKYKMWYRNCLRPYVHYVPVNADLSNLIEQIRWCRANDEKCQKIAENAKRFHDKYLLKDGALDYLQKLLVDLKRETGVYLYNYKTPFDLQLEREMKKIDLYYPSNKTIQIYKIPSSARTYGLLQGVEWMINATNDKSNFINFATKGDSVFKGSRVSVDKYELAGFSFVVKSTSEEDKIPEIIHETFVGRKCINDLCKYVPNFVYTFGKFNDSKNSNVVLEHVIGPTLMEYINSSNFKMDEYLFILAQISLALQVAQQRCGFVHYDLAPWNIIIQRLPSPVLFDYVVGDNKVYRVKTTLIPVIIDFGQSHVIYEGVHYGGTINTYKTSTIQDIVSILMTSIHIVLKRNLSKRDLAVLVQLANFISGTKYRRRPFSFAERDGIKKLRNFLDQKKKYSDLLFSNKYELEQRSPLDLVHYLMANFHGMSIKVGSTYKFNLNKGNARQVFDFIVSGTQQKRIQSYTDVFKRVRQCELPKTDNTIIVYYIIQSIRSNLDSVYNSMIRFLNSENISPVPMINIYTDTIKHLNKQYESLLNSSKMQGIKYNDVFDRLIQAPYDQNTFLEPNKVSSLLDDQKKQNDISMYKDIILYTLLYQGEFQLPPNVKEFYQKEYKNILSINTLYMKNNTANVKTLKTVSREVYSTDKTELSKKLAETNPEDDCNTSSEYIKLYNKILKKI